MYTYMCIYICIYIYSFPRKVDVIGCSDAMSIIGTKSSYQQAFSPVLGGPVLLYWWGLFSYIVGGPLVIPKLGAFSPILVGVHWYQRSWEPFLLYWWGFIGNNKTGSLFSCIGGGPLVITKLGPCSPLVIIKGKSILLDRSIGNNRKGDRSIGYNKKGADSPVHQ